MNELIEDRLYDFDGKVRIELGPQIVKLDCTVENLSNDVTHANYQMGSIDAHGSLIGDDLSMHCVDWKQNLVPYLWKVYQMQDGDTPRFMKVNEFENKQEALDFANSVLEDMK